MWILAVIGAGVLLIAAFLTLIRHGTLYISHSSGFNAFTSGQTTARKIPRAKIGAVCERLLQSDRFDHIFLGNDDEQADGFSIGVHFEGGYKISSTFSLNSDFEREQTFRSVMASLELPILEDDIFNEGLGDSLEARSLSYRVPSDARQMEQIAHRLLDALYPNQDSEIFISAAMIRNGPGSGISWKRKVDLLEGIVCPAYTYEPPGTMPSASLLSVRSLAARSS